MHRAAKVDRGESVTQVDTTESVMNTTESPDAFCGRMFSKGEHHGKVRNLFSIDYTALASLN